MARNGLLKGKNEHEFVRLTEEQVEVFIRPEERLPADWVQCVHCGLLWWKNCAFASLIGCWEEQRDRKQAIVDGDDEFVRPIVVFKAVTT